MGKMRRKTSTRTLCLGARIVGALLTSLMLFAAVPKLIAEIGDHGLKAYVSHLPDAFINWQDTPEAFFYTYMLGYLLTWWNPGVGGLVLVLVGAVPAVVWRDPVNSAVFYVPALVVGLLHLGYWLRLRKENSNRRSKLTRAMESP